ncbi:hypothetical protein TH63_02625 [Rufibacter radiotolerans]|uniref:Uncharacterized protein n=1 Tax=Rufibacter radiotolerans TaxID=1379910 RepID=A0A0H4W2U6_9BACT|nr:hypothetical protein [Rufibacter radiotolerans]AKQ44766.1 hypothetical protein TH63_02625 [Rufibacter radiotolerans]
METQHTASPKHLLEIGISDLHQESQTWLQEIEFWGFELNFYQKLLEKVTQKATADDKRHVDHFQQLIIYYQGELLPQFKKEVRKHEAYLQKLTQEKAPFDDQLYREVHLKHKQQIAAFSKDFSQYKGDLFRFAERYI